MGWSLESVRASPKQERESFGVSACVFVIRVRRWEETGRVAGEKVQVKSLGFVFIILDPIERSNRMVHGCYHPQEKGRYPAERERSGERREQEAER